MLSWLTRPENLSRETGGWYYFNNKTVYPTKNSSLFKDPCPTHHNRKQTLPLSTFAKLTRATAIDETTKIGISWPAPDNIYSMTVRRAYSPHDLRSYRISFKSEPFRSTFSWYMLNGSITNHQSTPYMSSTNFSQKRFLPLNSQYLIKLMNLPKVHPADGEALKIEGRAPQVSTVPKYAYSPGSGWSTASPSGSYSECYSPIQLSWGLSSSK